MGRDQVQRFFRCCGWVARRLDRAPVEAEKLDVIRKAEAAAARDLIVLGVADDWLLLRLEIHPALRIPHDLAIRLPLLRVIQYHALLDQADAEIPAPHQEVT